MTDQFTSQMQKLLGSWEGTGHIEPNPWGADGAITAQFMFRSGPGDHSVIHDYRDQREDGTSFAGHGVLTTDPATNEVLWFWFDSYGAPPLVPSRGLWNNGVLCVQRTTSRGSNRTSFAPSANNLLYKIDVCLPHEKEFSTLVRVAFSRVDPSA